jgi:hypothetical protein
MQICVLEQPCALHALVVALKGDQDENRLEQNDRAWRHITRNAARSGDSLDFDGDLTCLG